MDELVIKLLNCSFC